MASTFTSYSNKNVGTSAATVVTVATGAKSTIIGLSLANTITSPITADVYFTRSAVDYYLIKGATVPVGGALVVVGGDQKVVLIADDVLKVVTSATNSADAVTSVLNIT